MYIAFIKPNSIDPFISTLPPFFAKSSMLWTSVLYIFSNRQIKKQFSIDLLSVIKPNSTNDEVSKKNDRTIYKNRLQVRQVKRDNFNN